MSSAKDATNSTFSEVLQYLKEQSRNTAFYKGKLFEHLICKWLQVDKLHKDRFRNIYMWQDYPRRDGRNEIGIDIVAEEQDGGLCAIQCKFYEGILGKDEIMKFLVAANNYEFKTRMLVHISDGYGKNAEILLRENRCEVRGPEHLSQSQVDWVFGKKMLEVKTKPRYDIYSHQETAIREVKAGFEEKDNNGKMQDRGKMIMACGTGKTFTALKIAEDIVGRGGLVMYAVPSISLMQQTIRTWREQMSMPHKYVGVCSDPKVAAHSEQISMPIMEMEIPVTTDPNAIAGAIEKHQKKNDVMMVVFTTYQSMASVVEAMCQPNLKKIKFDLVLCDEAHRTTGVERTDTDTVASSFLLVHNNNNIPAKKRLYMTATDKIYVNKVRAKSVDAKIYSMDDKSIYGKDFHRLSFSEAVKQSLLSDYKVIVLNVDEKYVAELMHGPTEVISDNGDLNLKDSAKVLGIIGALTKPDQDSPNGRHLQTSIIYVNGIRRSKQIMKAINEEIKTDSKELSFKAWHVDGKQNASTRAAALQKLRESHLHPNTCRILTNDRCLAEGVDIANLDSVVFMDGRKSQIEIVQAVGRVMRTSPGKEYGYIIIPVGIPPDADENTILDSNETYGTVWNVVNAIRAHDDRFDKEINTKDVTHLVWGVYKEPNGKQYPNPEPANVPPLRIGELEIPRDKLYAKIVDKVGNRRYYEHWARDIAERMGEVEARIDATIHGNPFAKAKFNTFIKGLRDIINNKITDAHGIVMLAQHLITRRVFNAMFESDEFIKSNPISRAMEDVMAELDKHGLGVELESLEGFYKDVEYRIAGLDRYEQRQQVIHELYGKFFNIAFNKMSTQLGIVYTPLEIIDFIIRSVDHALRENFGKGITDRGVNIIDPFTGTGAFITRMMSSEIFLINDKDLERKYASELFASEIVLLAYYIAAINCESAYGQRTGKPVPFGGLTLTDTFNVPNLDAYTGDIMAEPKRRIRKQQKADITVIVSNPPYMGGQKKGSDDNQAIRHEDIEARIRNTYTAMARKVGYMGKILKPNDSYKKALRWASDRIGESGVVGFVIPASYMTAPADAGIRAVLHEEFTDVWCFDLRGGKHTKGDGRNIFEYAGSGIGGSTVATVITILVKNPNKEKHEIHYGRLTELDYSGADKRKKIKELESIANIKWEAKVPDDKHSWFAQAGESSEQFEKYTPLGSSKTKKRKTDQAIFYEYSNGLKTHRSSWTYNSSRKELEKNISRTICFCNRQMPKKFKIGGKSAILPKELQRELKQELQQKLTVFIGHPEMVAWSKELTRDLVKYGIKEFDKTYIRKSLYRPFFPQFVYADNIIVSTPSQMYSFFPKYKTNNPSIIVPDKINAVFSVLITKTIPDLTVLHAGQTGQCFPFYTYKNGVRQENVTDYALELYRDTYDDQTITKMEIFHYVYGLLHHKGYREKYQNNLISGIPNIPMAPNFDAFCDAGEKLAELHLSFESCAEYKLNSLTKVPSAPKKIQFGKKPNSGIGKKTIPDHSTLLLDGVKVFDDIPECSYQVGGWSPIKWFVDRYGRTEKKDTGITNYPLENKNGKEVQAIIQRLVYIGQRSDEIINGLPVEFEGNEPVVVTELPTSTQQKLI